MPAGGAAPSPTPEERQRRGQGMGYRLNPYEQMLLRALDAGVAAGLNPQIASEMLMGTVEGAMGRRQQNIATRTEGLMGLQEMGMQAAMRGADPFALQGALGNMAQNLPGMKGPRGQEELQGLLSFVDDVYQGQPVSGLMPATDRLALQGQEWELGQMMTPPPLLDEADRAQLGQAVMQEYQKGVPFKDIRAYVEQLSIAVGHTPVEAQAAQQEAERIYEQLSNVSLQEIRSLGDTFRQQQAMEGDWRVPEATGINGPVAGQDLYEQYVAQSPSGARSTGDEMDITGLLGWMASQRPEMLQGWMAEQPEPYSDTGSWYGGYLNNASRLMTPPPLQLLMDRLMG